MTRTARPTVMLPFPARRLGAAGEAVDVVEFVSGEPPAAAADAVFWVPHHSILLPYADVFARMPRLRVVQVQSAGYEHVARYLPPGVVLCNARGVHDAATSEHGVALILAALRGIPEFVAAQARGEWLPQTERRTLADSTVLIVGYGSIGAALERRLQGHECTVQRVARRARDGVHAVTSLPDLLPHADVVVILTPLDDATRGLAGREFLGLMKDGALLVNLARGGVVDTAALLAETASGRLRAALDVTDPEPLPSDHPLWTADGVLITPHAAGMTTVTVPRLQAFVADQIDRFVKGHPLRNVCLD